MSDDDAPHAARAVLRGSRLDLTSDEIFGHLKNDPRISSEEIRTARRLFDATGIGIAVESVENSVDKRAALAALLRLARALSPHLKDRQPGWFRFLLTLGGQPGDSMFRLSYKRRPHSSKSQPKKALVRATDTGRAMSDMIVAGAILSQIEAAKGDGPGLTVQDAIEMAINCDDIATDEEAARKAFQRFRKYCGQLTSGRNTYRLERYAGAIENYRGHWTALPEIGAGLPRLPSEKGGRPKKT